jgi:hypothetical protein
MPSRQAPTAFVATRALSLPDGTQVARGATVTLAQAATLGGGLDAVVSRGWLLPSPPQYVRTNRRMSTWQKRRHFSPYHLNPREFQALTAS